VKEHFLGFLAETKPDLGRELRRRYARSYLPAAERQKVVAPVVRALGGAGTSTIEHLVPARRSSKALNDAATDVAPLQPGEAGSHVEVDMRPEQLSLLP
jgi:hypothetical protein